MEGIKYEDLIEMRIDPQQLLRMMTQSLWKKMAHKAIGFEFEDLQQEGYLGLIDALKRTYAVDPTQLEAYLKMKIRYAQIDFVRRSKIFTSLL